jgi:hypothetical protein
MKPTYILNVTYFMIFEVLKAVIRKIVILWDATQCSLLDRYQRFGGTFSFHMQDKIVTLPLK